MTNSKLKQRRLTGRMAQAGATIGILGLIGVLLSACGPELAICAPDQPANSPTAPSPPQNVFCYDVAAADETLQIDWVIDPGAYLYRDKFHFTSTDPDLILGTPVIPTGERYYDEFFDEEKEIYRESLQISIPYTRTAAIGSAAIEIELQGCDETIGLCYPPQNWMATVSLPEGPIAAAAAPPVASTSSNVPEFFAAGATSDEPLPIEQAFIPNPRFDSANELTVAWQIEPGYYLYRDKFTFTVDEGEIQFGSGRMPAGQMHDDLEFGEVEVYVDDVDLIVPFTRPSPDAQAVTFTVGYQGCKEGSICYPPSEQTFSLTLPDAAELAAGALPPPPARVSDQDRYASLLTDGSWFALLGSFYLGGLLLSFTPCVLPMVPILSGMIAGQGTQVSAGRGFALSASYVFGMAATYTAAGVLAALAGSQTQAIFQKPWIIASFAGLFVIMALGMFGLFTIQMPAAIQTRVNALANRQKGGTFIGTAIVGALTALIVTTCVAPVLIGALAFIGQTGDVFRGGAALFIMAIGMGTPLLLVGASAGQVLPRVGPWMNIVKAAFGVMMIGMAIWLLQGILPGSLTLALWALLVFLSGVFLGAFEPLPENPRPARRLAKGFGVLACLYGALLLIGSTLGGEDPLHPLPEGIGSFAGAPQEPEGPDFVRVDSVNELESLLADARTAGQPVMIDFTAWWCRTCLEMEEYTFPDPAVLAALGPFMVLQADVADNTEDDKALLAYFESFGPPTIAFFDRYGRNLNASGYTLVGFEEADLFAARVNDVAAL